MQGKQAQLLANYYAILGVKSSASVQEVKDAFREKAKKLHPDVNPSEKAHHEFILLKKAYNYVLGVKTGKTPIEKEIPKTYNNPTYQRPNNTRTTQANKNGNYRQQARPKYAKRKTINPEVLRDEKHGAIIISTILLSILLPTYFLLIVLLPLNFGEVGIAVAFFSIGATCPLTIASYNWLRKYSKKDKQEAYHRLKNSVSAQIIFGCLCVLFGYIFFASKTFLPIWSMLLLLIVPSACMLLFLPKKSKKFLFRRKFLAFAIWPFLLFCFFALNYAFSRNPRKETYPYQWKPKNGMTHIELPNQMYKEFSHIRTFYYQFEDVQDYQSIQYEIATGLFGIPVLKDYQLLEYDYEKVLEKTIQQFSQ